MKDKVVGPTENVTGIIGLDPFVEVGALPKSDVEDDGFITLYESGAGWLL